MASIEEVRAGIDAAKEKASESLGALQQAQSALEEAQAQMQQVTEGSGQADVSEANAMLAQAVTSIYRGPAERSGRDRGVGERRRSAVTGSLDEVRAGLAAGGRATRPRPTSSRGGPARCSTTRWPS